MFNFPPHHSKWCCPLTVDEVLLLLRQDAGEVCAVETTLSLCSIPGAAVSEVLVAVRLKLLPTKATLLSVCDERKRLESDHRATSRSNRG